MLEKLRGGEEVVGVVWVSLSRSDGLLMIYNRRERPIDPLHNIQKGPWTLKQVGWQDTGLPSADEAWDGMTGWFRRYMRTAPAEVWVPMGRRYWSS